MNNDKKSAYVIVTEEPVSKGLRFRYECEGRSAGSIPGASSTSDKKTFPTIQVLGYKGRAVVVVSTVTSDPPYRPHPYNLVGKEGCKKGVCTLELNSETMSVSFPSLGIQCVKKKEIEEALTLRETIRVDPFGTGFEHKESPQSVDLNIVRLCFQVFLEEEETGAFTFPLKPVVSKPIYDKKARSDLTICKMTEYSASVGGGKEMLLFCDKIAKDDIQVRFYEESPSGKVLWEDFGDFQPSDVHKQYGICFRTPRYKNIEIECPIKIQIQLRRPSDGAVSEPRAFELTPLDAGKGFWTSKRIKSNYNVFNNILTVDQALSVKSERESTKRKVRASSFNEESRISTDHHYLPIEHFNNSNTELDTIINTITPTTNTLDNTINTTGNTPIEIMDVDDIHGIYNDVLQGVYDDVDSSPLYEEEPPQPPSRSFHHPDRPLPETPSKLRLLTSKLTGDKNKKNELEREKKKKRGKGKDENEEGLSIFNRLFSRSKGKSETGILLDHEGNEIVDDENEDDENNYSFSDNIEDELSELQQFINSGNLEHLDNMVTEFSNQYMHNAQESTISFTTTATTIINNDNNSIINNDNNSINNNNIINNNNNNVTNC